MIRRPSARWFVDDYAAPRIELPAPGFLSVPSRPGLGYQVDHAKVRCFDGPSFLLPTADLASVPAPANLRASGQERPR